MIAALYVHSGGAYTGLSDVDPWGTDRDARLYAGPHPVVAHPPCSSWCQIAHVNEARYGHKVGDDGGCFVSALGAVRLWGGVLEHPANSYAWPAFGLPRPVRGAWQRDMYEDAWVTEVNQRAYGHRAKKATWLYYVGPTPAALDWSNPKPVATISWLTNHGGGDLPRLNKREASATPPAFRDLLLALARGATGYARVVTCQHCGTRSVEHRTHGLCPECFEEAA